MAIPVQKTKLYTPPVRENWIDRKRLEEKLDSLLTRGYRAALISAPAGSGKTTLLVQWLNRQKIQTGWLSLDERDNNPARFFSYLIAALQEIVPGAGREALALSGLPGADPDEIITLLTNDLTDKADLFLMVLDDFHVITNPLLHQVVDLLIDAQPPQMRLVLLSREDPGIQLARRRARGQLVELRQADVSFTLEEAAAFLNQSMGLHLTPEQVQLLEARTEGWIAGLQMASLAMQTPSVGDRPAYIHRFFQEFSGNHRYILDYLMEEVLARQGEDIQAFLLETSIFDRFTAELCAAVTGRTTAESQKLLEHIFRANLFVIPLDDVASSAHGRRWFRYHHLFGDLLLARLQSEDPSHAKNLFLRASDWFEANGEPHLAVEYALKAHDPQRAAGLIERHITERWQTVDMEFFKLVNRLPFEVIADRPSLCLQSAWLCVMFGQTGRILPYVEAAERALDRSVLPPQEGGESGSAMTNRAFARTLRAYVDDLRNLPVVLDGSLEPVYQSIPETNPGMRNSVGVVIGMISFMEGDFTSAMRYFEDAIALDKRVNGTNAVPIATMRICFVLQAQGQLREAMRRLNESEAYVRERGIRRFYISGALHLRRADILLEWNRLDEAEAQIHEGMRLLEDWTIPSTRSLGLNLLARTRIARGDLDGARSILAQVDAIRQQIDLHPTFLDSIERVRVQLFIAEQNQAGLEAWVAENQPDRQKPLHFRYEARLIEVCRAWLALGRGEEAVDLLERLAESALDRNGSRVTVLALLAAALLQQQPERAIAVLEVALQLAEPEGYLRTFVETGQPMNQVLNLWLKRGQASSDPRLWLYAQSIQSCFETTRTAPSAAQAAIIPEPLSQREQEVLLLLAKGLSNQQIADRLVISVRTVKKHVENIHGKLGVQNRTQAVIRAQELGLLS